MVNQKVGGWAFILGVLVAIIAGLAAGAVAMYAGWITLLLVVLGLVVGLLNVGDKDVQGFLIAAIALMAVGTANLAAIPYVGIYLASIVQNVAAFVAPAALVVALKEVYNIARKP
ncbi:MAG: hypothetical protein DRO99_00840 [Candidatus Aenigmatarchaeota archaeon]|nr:MAG: hypothetical protein DRO99_00840 [Candidatus Aenigmarchaeota archaeon]